MKDKLIKFLLPLALLFACLGFAACDKTPESLSAPENLRIEDGVLYWDEVDYADGYTVYIDGAEYQTKDCRFGLGELSETEIHAFEVRAYTDNGIQSPYADISYTGRYAVPTEGLEYRFSEDAPGWGLQGEPTPHFRVTKLAVDENGSCVIPASYEGVPVMSFNDTNTPESVLNRIKSIYLPNCIDEYYLKSYYFARFPNLENLVLGERDDKFYTEENCLIDRETNTLLAGCINSKIPDSVTTIGGRAFCERNLKEIIVPDTVTKIGDSAFYGCSELKKVVLPERLESQTLKATFSNCSSLTAIKIPEGVKTLDTTFAGCSALTDVTLPEGVTKLYYTFEECTSLKSLAIPESVTSMEVTFWGCTAMESFTVPGNVKALKATFYGCTSLKQVTLEEGVETLSFLLGLGGTAAYGTFGRCYALTDVSLPSTLKSLDPYGFRDCVALESIELPEGLTTIPKELFTNCTALKSITISETVTRIRGNCFQNCTSLQSLIVPDSVLKLENAFDGCTALKSVVLPKKVKTDSPLFEDCPLEEVYYRGTEEEWEENKSNIYKENTVLFSATRYYYSETTPAEEGNFWHFVEGVPTKW